MTRRKTSPGMAMILSEEHWAIPEETRKKMLYEYLSRNTPCHVCKHSLLRLKSLGESLCYACTHNLAPREGCVLFELDKGRVIIGSDVVNLHKEEEKQP